MKDLTIIGSDDLVHRVFVAPKERAFHSEYWLRCTGENLFSIKPDATNKVITCLECLCRDT